MLETSSAMENRAAASAASGKNGGPGGDVEAAPPLAAPIEQRVIKTGEITLEVGNVGEALGRVRSLADELRRLRRRIAGGHAR